ncbi:TPA: hypothetical protein EYM26_18815 [Candidatus Poribacteria bacterium]|nr:hypothetical protein [Candidatus Poribacteria bacterium]
MSLSLTVPFRELSRRRYSASSLLIEATGMAPILAKAHVRAGCSPPAEFRISINPTAPYSAASGVFS